MQSEVVSENISAVDRHSEVVIKNVSAVGRQSEVVDEGISSRVYQCPWYLHCKSGGRQAVRCCRRGHNITIPNLSRSFVVILEKLYR